MSNTMSYSGGYYAICCDLQKSSVTISQIWRWASGWLASAFFGFFVVPRSDTTFTEASHKNLRTHIDPIKTIQRSSNRAFLSLLFHLKLLYCCNHDSWKVDEKEGEGLKKFVHLDAAEQGKENAVTTENAPPESARSMPSAQQELTKDGNVAVQPQDESHMTPAVDEPPISYHGEEMWA